MLLGDRLVLSMINRKQVNSKGFTTEASNAVRMSDDTRKAILVAYQEKKTGRNYASLS